MAESEESASSNLVLRLTQAVGVLFGIIIVALLPYAIGKDFVSSEADLLTTYLHGSVVVLVLGGATVLVVWLITQKLDIVNSEE